MNNKTGFNRLGRKPSHRRALLKNLAASLLQHEQITTTKAKAKELRRTAEKMITRAKTDTVHNRRLVARSIQDKELIKKLFTQIAPRYASRSGGYTRIVKIGLRQGDAAEMVIIELVDREQGSVSAPAAPETKVKKSPAKKTAANAKKPAAKTAKTAEKEPESETKAGAAETPAEKTAIKKAAKPAAAAKKPAAKKPKAENNVSEEKKD